MSFLYEITLGAITTILCWSTSGDGPRHTQPGWNGVPTRDILPRENWHVLHNTTLAPIFPAFDGVPRIECQGTLHVTDDQSFEKHIAHVLTIELRRDPSYLLSSTLARLHSRPAVLGNNCLLVYWIGIHG